MIKKLIFLCIFCFSLNSLFADEIHQKEKKVDAILDLSGIQKQTLQLKELMAVSLKAGIRTNKNLTDEQVEQIYKISIEEFRPESILAGIRNKLMNDWAEKEIEELYTFYNQPKIKKFSRMEEESTSASAQPAMVEFAKGLQKIPPENEKINTIVSFMKNVKIVEKSISVLTDLSEGIAVAFGSALSSEAREKIKQQYTPGATQNILVAYLFTYREVSNNDLKDYLNSYTTNKNLMRLGEEQLAEQNKGFKKWGLDLGKRMKAELKPAQNKLNCEKRNE